MIKITETLHYDPITGNAWYTIPKNYSRILMASDTSRYLHVRVGKKKYRLHRLVWEKINGQIPDGMQIDHIDCNKRNNALSNLRCVDSLTNARNKKPPANSTGYPGVCWNAKDKLWSANLSVGGKTVWAKSGSDARELYNGYREAKIRFHGEDSIRHYPPTIETSNFTVYKAKRCFNGNGRVGRGRILIRSPRPYKHEHNWTVSHKGKTAFRSKVEQEAREFAANLRKELDNKRASSTTQP